MTILLVLELTIFNLPFIFMSPMDIDCCSYNCIICLRFRTTIPFVDKWIYHHDEDVTDLARHLWTKRLSQRHSLLLPKLNPKITRHFQQIQYLNSISFRQQPLKYVLPTQIFGMLGANSNPRQIGSKLGVTFDSYNSTF